MTNNAVLALVKSIIGFSVPAFFGGGGFAVQTTSGISLSNNLNPRNVCYVYTSNASGYFDREA